MLYSARRPGAREVSPRSTGAATTLSPTSRSPARVDDIPLASQTPGAVPGLAEADGRRIAEALHTPAAPTPGHPTPPAWRRFTAWSEARGWRRLTAAPEQVAAYLTELADAHRLSVATLRLHRSSVGAVHRNAGFDDPTAHGGVSQVLAGLARANATRSGRRDP